MVLVIVEKTHANNLLTVDTFHSAEILVMQHGSVEKHNHVFTCTKPPQED